MFVGGRRKGGEEGKQRVGGGLGGERRPRSPARDEVVAELNFLFSSEGINSCFIRSIEVDLYRGSEEVGFISKQRGL